MKKVFLAYMALAAFIMALLAAVPAFAQLPTPAAVLDEPVIRVRGTAVPGGVIFVSVEGEGLTGGTWHWATHEGKLTPAPYGLRTALAVPLDAVAGAFATLRLEVKGGNGSYELSRRIDIAHKWRPVQYLSMSASNDAKYSDPQADREEELVLAALYDLKPGVFWRGNFREPSSGPRSSPYGVRRIRNGRTAGFHRGLDYADWEGEPVVAPAGGIVGLAGHGYVLLGNCVILNHGEGITSIYMHLSRILVKDGQRVTAGQEIGRVGNTGASTGPHLHYAVYCQGEPVDPDLMRSIPKAWAPEAF